MVAGGLAAAAVRRLLGRPAPPVPSSKVVPVNDAVFAFGHPHRLAFSVPLETWCTYLYFSFDPTGWHPFTATARQLHSEPRLPYERSILRRFYDTFQPRSQAEAYFGDSRASGPSARYVLEPWLDDQRVFNDNGGHGNQNMGPISAERGEIEFDRLRRVYRSICERGYRPDTSSYIRGFFLRDGDAYRFHVTAGLHRAGVLSALGYESALVGFDPLMPRSVDLSDLHRWPQVRDGRVPSATAERAFRRFFTEAGDGRARQLGLLPLEDATVSTFEQTPSPAAGEGGRDRTASQTPPAGRADERPLGGTPPGTTSATRATAATRAALAGSRDQDGSRHLDETVAQRASATS
jgi:hypothetical protein